MKLTLLTEEYIRQLPNKALTFYHSRTHVLNAKDKEKVKEVHEMLVKEMEARAIKHASPWTYKGEVEATQDAVTAPVDIAE